MKVTYIETGFLDAGMKDGTSVELCSECLQLNHEKFPQVNQCPILYPCSGGTTQRHQFNPYNHGAGAPSARRTYMLPRKFGSWLNNFPVRWTVSIFVFLVDCLTLLANVVILNVSCDLW